MLIARDFLSPVATKELAGALRTPAHLLGASLIHDERPTGWADWLRSAGVDPNSTWHGINFSDSDLALAAAEYSQGVALGSLFLAEAAPRAAIRPRVWCGAWMIRNFHARSASGIRPMLVT